MRFPMPAAVLLPFVSLACLQGADTPKESVKEQFARRAAKLWTLQPVAKPVVRSGPTLNEATASTNPIDAFITADYRAEGLIPAEKADKVTLLRRVSLDLTGIPPTPAEQEAFLADTAPVMIARTYASRQA